MVFILLLWVFEDSSSFGVGVGGGSIKRWGELWCHWVQKSQALSPLPCSPSQPVSPQAVESKH